MTTTSNKSTAKPIAKPMARLDASLLLARKGEASPAVAATQHNNPGLAWGAPVHPGDFTPHLQEAPHVAAPQPAADAASGPVVTARLRPDSFFTAHSRSVSKTPKTPWKRPAQDREPVALTMRVADETYLRLKYLAQSKGRSTQQVLADALDDHLVQNGVIFSRKLVVKPE